MTDRNIVMNAEFCAVATAASVDGMHWCLMGVHIAGNDAVATDGHLLLYAPIEWADDQQPELHGAPVADQVTIPGKLIKMAQKLVGRGKKATPAIIANNQAALHRDGQVMRIQQEPITDTFPNWRSVLPKPDQAGAVQVIIHGNMLQRMADVCKIVGGRHTNAVRLTIVPDTNPTGATLNPIAAEFLGDDDRRVSGVIMPCMGPDN